MGLLDLGGNTLAPTGSHRAGRHQQGVLIFAFIFFSHHHCTQFDPLFHSPHQPQDAGRLHRPSPPLNTTRLISIKGNSDTARSVILNFFLCLSGRPTTSTPSSKVAGPRNQLFN